jgi:predicted GNAT family N-acyltransferase
MSFYITTIDFATPEYDETVSLRYDILRRPLGLEFSETELAEEYAQTHFVGYDAQNSTLLGCLVLKKYSEEVVKMRQVAVRANEQGKGIGKQLVKAAEAWAKRAGFLAIELHARASAVPFYEHLGYAVTSAAFEEVTIEHFAMRLSLD